MTDYPWLGHGTCINYNGGTDIVSILEFNEQQPDQTHLIRIFPDGTTVKENLTHPHMEHGEGDYVIWIAKSETLWLYDVCDERPYQNGDLLNLNPLTDPLPQPFLKALREHLPPQSYLASILNQ